jgi:hypothetical protein
MPRTLDRPPGGPGQSGPRAVSLGLIVLAVLALVAQAVDWSVPVRPIVVIVFVAVGPGLAVLRPFGLAGGWAGFGLVIAVSLALAMLVSGTMLYAGAWSPFASLVVLAVVTVAGAVVSLAGVGRDADAAPLPSASR